MQVCSRTDTHVYYTQIVNTTFFDSCFQSIAIEVVVLSFIGAVLHMERFALQQGQERDSMFAGALLQVVFLVCKYSMYVQYYIVLYVKQCQVSGIRYQGMR